MSDFTYDVFISYSSLDSQWVRDWLLARLEAEGLRVSIDVRDFEIGAPILDNIESAVRQSAKTLLVLTPNWLQSEWTKFESLLLQTEDPAGTRRRLLPLMLDKCDLPRRLSLFTHVDFTDPANWEKQLTRLVNAIRGENQQPGTRAIQPNLAHPYAIQANFTGRAHEREELTEWLAGDAHPICALIAMGGMGKSALAWYWMQHDVLAQEQSASKLEGVMWWSFYEGEAAFAKFIDEAYKYVTGQQSIDMQRLPSTYDRAQELRQHLQTKRILFILDGFERQLRSYASLDAAYKQDDHADPSREARSCVDSTASRWLRDIASGATRAKLLLTTRLMPGDLEDRAGDPLAGALKKELKELPREDAITFMRAQGVTKGTNAEIDQACAAYGYHPLSLRLLSGLIARDARTPGDIAAAPRHDVHDDLIQRQHHVLKQSYDALHEEARTLLSSIAAFRNPVTYDDLLIFNTLANEASFEYALENLRARGLLQRDIAQNRYDLHPLVRHYAYERLADKKGVHRRLRDYFANIPVPDEDQIQRIEDLAPLIELYHHTVRAGEHDEAVELFSRHLHVPIYYRFGAYQTQVDLLRSLFPGGNEYPQYLKTESEQAWVMHALANAYSISGQPRHAVPLYERKNVIREKLQDKGNFARGLGDIAIFGYRPLGELAAAERALQRHIELCREVQDKGVEAIGLQDLGRLAVYRGEFDEAESKLKAAQDVFDKYGEGGTNFVSVVRSYRAHRALIMGNARAALEAVLEARRLAIFERDIIRAEWLLGAARVMLGEDLNAAETHLTDALTRCRRINMVDHEPDILLTWARLYHARGNAQEAQAYADEALAIANRCEYRLVQADAHNFMAWLALEANNKEDALKHAEIAKERAWCDGPPYCYKPALDEAEGLLRELGASG